MSNIDLDQVYTPQEVAQFLRCSPFTVNAMIDRGDLPAKILTVGKKKMRRVTRSALEKFMAQPDVQEQDRASFPRKRDGDISNVTSFLKRQKRT